MLVIARRAGETVLVGDNIEITISAIRGDQVRLAIRAPRSISILRKETVGQTAPTVDPAQLARDNEAALSMAGATDLSQFQALLGAAPPSED